MDRRAEIMCFDINKGDLLNSHEEPVYGNTYLPCIFKVEHEKGGERQGDDSEKRASTPHPAKKYM